MHPWNRYVAIGDSFTEGVGDSVEGFAKLGAMDRLADALRQSKPDLRYTNLAKRGLLLAEVCEQQLETALSLKPDFVTIVAGINDILKGQFDEVRWEAEMRMLYEPLTQTGAVVITGNVPKFPLLNTLKEPMSTRIKRNISKGDTIIERLAAQYPVILIDAREISSQCNPDDWSEDGVHPNSRGYFKFAKGILGAIEQRVGFKIGEIGEP